MGRIIELSVNNKIYKLEFTRRTLLEVSAIQEDIAKAKTPLESFNMFAKLVAIALKKNHSDLPQSEVEDIVDSIGNINEFATALNQIIEGSINTLEKEGNAHWEVK